MACDELQRGIGHHAFAGCRTPVRIQPAGHVQCKNRRRLRVDRIELTVFADNEPAIAVYKKHGFEIEGTGKRYALRNGEYVDAYYMARMK